MVIKVHPRAVRLTPARAGPRGAFMAQGGNAGQRQPRAPDDHGHLVPGGLDGSELARISGLCDQAVGPAPAGMAAISLVSGQPDRYLAVNDAYCELTGYSRGELTG